MEDDERQPLTPKTLSNSNINSNNNNIDIEDDNTIELIQRDIDMDINADIDLDESMKLLDLKKQKNFSNISESDPVERRDTLGVNGMSKNGNRSSSVANPKNIKFNSIEYHLNGNFNDQNNQNSLSGTLDDSLEQSFKNSPEKAPIPSGAPSGVLKQKYPSLANSYHNQLCTGSSETDPSSIKVRSCNEDPCDIPKLDVNLESNSYQNPNNIALANTQLLNEYKKQLETHNKSIEEARKKHQKTMKIPLRICWLFFRLFLPISIFCGCIFRYNFISVIYLILLLLGPVMPSYKGFTDEYNLHEPKVNQRSTANTSHTRKENRENQDPEEAIKIPTTTKTISKLEKITNHYILVCMLIPILILLAQTINFILQIYNCQISELSSFVCSCSYVRHFGFYRLDLADPINKIRIILPDIVVFFISIITFMLHQKTHKLNKQKSKLLDTKSKKETADLNIRIKEEYQFQSLEDGHQQENKNKLEPNINIFNNEIANLNDERLLQDQFENQHSEYLDKFSRDMARFEIQNTLLRGE